eukprot:gene1012-gene371
MRHVGRNEERLSFADHVIHDPVVLIGLDDDVALNLREELLGVDLMEIIACIWARDHHDEEVSSAVEILVSHRWLEIVPVGFDP